MEELVVAGAEVPLACAHPVDVPLNRVDLSVVAEKAERLRPLPRGCRVRREALVEDAERKRERRLAQVGVEVCELVGCAERLVGDRSERQRGDVRTAGAPRPPAGAGPPPPPP